MKIHAEGKDSNGFLTIQKNVLSIYNENRDLIGFTVLTFKRGGSVKSGPTAFFVGSRSSGYGQLLREALSQYLRSKGYRKIYCTATVVNKEVVNYLLSAGYKIECQLKAQYGMFDELVMGKILLPSEPVLLNYKSEFAKDTLALVGLPTEADEAAISSFIQKHFSLDIVKVSKKVSSAFVKDSFRSPDLSYEQKPKTIIVSKTHKKILALCICLPKRGGSFKAVLLSGKVSRTVLENIIRGAEREGKKKRRKKIYFTVPENRLDHIECLKKLKYRFEGTLHEPYQRGINIFIFSKQF